MTTVGYGDMFPCTSCGRIVCIILVIWGIFIVSIMVVVLTNTFQMDQSKSNCLFRVTEGLVADEEAGKEGRFEACCCSHHPASFQMGS